MSSSLSVGLGLPRGERQLAKEKNLKTGRGKDEETKNADEKGNSRDGARQSTAAGGPRGTVGAHAGGREGMAGERG